MPSPPALCHSAFHIQRWQRATLPASPRDRNFLVQYHLPALDEQIVGRFFGAMSQVTRRVTDPQPFSFKENEPH
jgi:hypothetical protein